MNNTCIIPVNYNYSASKLAIMAKNLAVCQQLIVLCVITLLAVNTKVAAKIMECFETQYIMDGSFAAGFSFANVSDISVDTESQQVWILQRSQPPVTVWNSITGKLLMAWNTQELGCPHSIELSSFDGTVWITDMAGELLAGEEYGHCVKHFERDGSYINSIGKCGQHTSGSSLDPPQFDKVTDIAIDSRGYAYITDGDLGGMNNRVMVFDQNYELVDTWNKENTKGDNPLQFNLPHSVRIDSCARVWVVDTLNHRIQVISNDGEFLGQWKCFGESLLYGIDLDPKKGTVLLTSITSDGDLEILSLSFSSADCSNPSSFGECRILKRLILSQDQTQVKTSVMLHSVAVDGQTGAVYLAELPGNKSPMKYVPAPAPPANNFDVCSEYNRPPQWNPIWSTTALLTPFDEAGDLITAKIDYSAQLDAMYFRLLDPEGNIQEYLNIGSDTYILNKDSCLGPYDYGWITPSRQWISNPDCECKGTYNASNIKTVAWACPTKGLTDWYWFHESDNSLWRMIINNSTNPYDIPVLGNFTMVHFTSLGSNITALLSAYDVCSSNIAKQAYYPQCSDEDNCTRTDEDHNITTSGTYVEGFSYSGCPTTLPSWPEQIYMTTTMLPVSSEYTDPLPTSVLYDWPLKSQRTTMCMATEIYNAYLLAANTYINTQDRRDGKIECGSHKSFGPPRPNWMTLDSCKCKGTITNNRSLSPWSVTTILVCPMTAESVFWAWYTTSDFAYHPLLFFETKSPLGEGTNLAVADYHDFYDKEFLIDVGTFEVPEICKNQ